MDICEGTRHVLSKCPIQGIPMSPSSQALPTPALLPDAGLFVEGPGADQPIAGLQAHLKEKRPGGTRQGYLW